MIQSVGMNETAGMLEARLRLIERIRRVEHKLARDEQVKVAAELMRGRSHSLGNHIQIVKLSSLELERRAQGRDDLVELLTDMRQAAEQATAVLGEMFAAAQPVERTAVRSVVTPTVRAAVDAARPAFAGDMELRIDLDDSVQTHSTAEELEAIMLAAMLDAVHATRMTIVVRERVVQGKRLVEILRIDNRQQFGDGDLAYMFEPPSLLHLVVTAAKQASGDASIAPGRGGLELAIELPVATKPLG